MVLTPSASPTEQQVAEFSVRPFRFGYIVNREVNQDVLLQIYRYNSSIWGGYYSLFVPSDGQSIRNDWWRQLYFHDPDVFFLVGEISNELANELYKRLQPMQIFVWNEKSLESLLGKPTKINPLHIDVMLEQIFAEKGKTLPEKSLIRYPDIEDGLFAPYLNTAFGSWLPESNYDAFAEENLGAVKIDCRPTTLREYLDILDEFEHWITPLAFTTRQLDPPSFENISFFGGYVIVLSTGMLDDLFIFHALRWSTKSSEGKPTSVIIPHAAVKSREDYQRLAEWFGEKVGGNAIEIISFSVDMDTLISFRESLREFLPSRRKGWVINIERCNIDVPVPTVKHLKRQQIINVSANRYSFELPKPEFGSRLNNHRYKHKRWISEIDLSPGFGNRRGFQPSMFPDLNLLLSSYPDRRLLTAGSPVRIARGKLALPTTVQNDVATIRLPVSKLLIETACENAGYTVNKNGSIYYEGMINLLGSLENADFLRNPHLQELFRDSDFLQGNALTVIEMYKRKGIPKADKPEFIEKIQACANRQILLRGYRLTCPVCGTNAWYEVSRIQEEMVCDGCRASFPLKAHIDFAFRLNHLFMERQNHGAIAVILTLLVLYNTSWHGILWNADIELAQRDDAENADAVEVDIIAMCDGYLIFAECKNRLLSEQDKMNPERRRDKLDEIKTQLEQEIKVAIAMEAQLFLFATLEEETPDEIQEFISRQDEQYDRLRVRLLSANELLQGQFITEESDRRRISYHEIVGELLLPPTYQDGNCSSKDANWPYGSETLW